MKFESIHVQHFGHFANFDLEFAGQPLVLLFGQNEAGKTTLLEFFRQLLFGFPERTAYTFGEGGELGGSARLQLADTRFVELKRRKGRKNTLQARVDGSDAELDDAGFRQLLGNANENVFKTVFAFGLDELRTGTEGLKEESLQSALFGGGLGGAFNPETLLKDLETEAGNLFRPSASKPSINAITADLKKLAAEVKQKTIRPDDYEQRERAWKEAQAEADRLAAELAQLRQKHARTTRLADALPIWLKLHVLKKERHTLVIPPALPRDAEHQFETTQEAIGRLTRDLDNLSSENDEAKRQLESLRLDRTLLPLRNEIEDCHRLIQSVADARRDLPLRREERARVDEEIQSELNRLLPGWTLENLREFALTAANQHTFEELLQQRAQLNEDRTRLDAKQTQLRAAKQQNDSDWESLGELQDVSELIALLEQSADYTADQKWIKKEYDEQSKLLRAVESQQARLSPPLPLGSNTDSLAIQRLPVPPRELVARLNAERNELVQRLQSAQQAVEDVEQQRQQLQRELSQLERQHQSVPGLDVLRQHRAERDQMWALLRARYIDQIGGKSAAPQPDQYEQAVRSTDEVADRIYDHADEVARREQFGRQLADLADTLKRRADECERVQRDKQDWEAKWLELWRPCGVTPLSSDLMLSWLDAFLAFCSSNDTLIQRQVELNSCKERIAAFESKLRSTMATPDGEAKSLLAAVKQFVNKAEEDSQQRKQLERDRKRLDKQLHDIDRDLQSWQDSELTWQSKWQQFLQQLGLPIDWDSGLAQQVISQLNALREKSHNLAELQRRIGRMEARIAEFDPRVRSLCDKLGERIDSDHPENTAAALQQRLAEATQSQERRNHLESQITGNQKREREKTTELQTWREKYEQLLLRAHATSDESFLAVTAQSRRASELDLQIQEMSGQLAIARGHEPEEAFFGSLETAELGILQAELGDLERTLKECQLAAEQAREKAGGLRCRFEELDGSNSAALVQEQIAQQQARLASEIHRYVPLAFARHLLQSAIRRFERDNQPEMIRDISRLFNTMTRGRYLEIERPTSDRNALFIRRFDGHELSPDQLSTGTRELLYLAIRLGYVVHYCKQSEPLPIVMDDVLVNFDAERAQATLEALRDVSQQVQVLFFTCHRHVVDLVSTVFPDIRPSELPARTMP